MLAFWFTIHSLLWHLFVEIGGIKLYINIAFSLACVLPVIVFRKRINSTSLLVTALLGAYLFASFFISVAGPCEDDFMKPLKALILLLIVVFIHFLSLEVGAQSNIDSWLTLRKASRVIVAITILGCLIEMIFPEIASTDKLKYHIEGKYAGIYDEPSNLAMSLFTPLAILFSSSQKRDRLWGIVGFILLLFLARSATLIQGVLVWILLRIFFSGYIKQGLIMLGGSIAAVIVASIVNYQTFVYPFVTRVAGVLVPDRNSGFSSLVYVKGWQDAFVNFWRTNGMGLGVNMMGCNPLPETSIRNIFRAIGGRELASLNDTNGSFLLSKMLSETGIFGLLFFIGLVILWYKLNAQSNSSVLATEREAYEIQATILLGLLLTFVFRGSNYYEGLLFITTAVLGQYLLNRTK